MSPVELGHRWHEASAAGLAEAVELRHALHATPHVGGEEGPTAQAVVDWLGAGEGTVVAGTGRLLRLQDGEGAPVVLRAELDALPILEETGVPWAAAGGVMHACGHDVHLGALGLVARSIDAVDFPAPLWLLLQPREEGSDPGARDVVAEGPLAGARAVLAAHVQPRLPAGVVAATPGAVNAAFDEFTLTVHGRGGHSGYPHTVADPVLALSAIVVALQQVAARRVDPTVGVACMVTQVQAGTASNVVPAVATGRGTLRTMRPSDRAAMVGAIGEIAEATARAHGCTVDVVMTEGDPLLVNDPGLAARAAAILGELDLPTDQTFRSFGSDDFAYYGPVAPSLMLFVGTGAERGGLHESTYLPDDAYVGLVADALIAGACAALT